MIKLRDLLKKAILHWHQRPVTLACFCPSFNCCCVIQLSGVSCNKESTAAFLNWSQPSEFLAPILTLGFGRRAIFYRFVKICPNFVRNIFVRSIWHNKSKLKSYCDNFLVFLKFIGYMGSGSTAVWAGQPVRRSSALKLPGAGLFFLPYLPTFLQLNIECTESDSSRRCISTYDVKVRNGFLAVLHGT